MSALHPELAKIMATPAQRLAKKLSDPLTPIGLHQPPHVKCISNCLGLGKKSTEAEDRMASLTSYSLGADDYLANDKQGSDGKPRDVLGEQLKQHGYAKTELHPCVLFHPQKRTGTEVVLYLSGYGRNMDVMELAPLFRKHAAVDLAGLDVRGYGMTYKLARERTGQGHTWGYGNFLTIDEYYPDIEAAISALLGMGYERIILWGNSTAGLIMTCYLRDRLPEGATSYRGVCAAVCDSPFWKYATGKFGPAPGWKSRPALLMAAAARQQRGMAAYAKPQHPTGAAPHGALRTCQLNA